MNRCAHLLVLLALSQVLGCSGRPSSPQPGAAPGVAHAPVAPVEPPSAPSGTVIGIVRLAQGAVLPSWPAQAMPRPPGTQVPRPEVCGPPKLTDTQSARLDAATRALEGILVAPSDFDHAPPAGPVTHQLTIRECRLEPAFLVATVGDRVRLANATDYPFLPTAGAGSGITQALLSGQTRDLTLGHAGPRMVGCSALGVACGRSDIMVMAHPLHAVTSADGRFRIERVPANQDLHLHAWNPLFQESVVPLRLSPGETKTVEFALTPATLQVPAEPPPGPPRDPREGDIH